MKAVWTNLKLAGIISTVLFVGAAPLPKKADKPAVQRSVAGVQPAKKVTVQDTELLVAAKPASLVKQPRVIRMEVTAYCPCT
jgi:hypothetical protein